jgi:hypothetical protein
VIVVVATAPVAAAAVVTLITVQAVIAARQNAQKIQRNVSVTKTIK